MAEVLSHGIASLGPVKTWCIVIGGLVGILLVLPLNNITTSVGNFITFSETSFNFRVSPFVMALGVGFALILGALGGLLPARMAARKEILTALREI